MKNKEFYGNLNINVKVDSFQKIWIGLNRRSTFFLDKKFWIFDGSRWEKNKDLYYSRLFKSPLQPMKVKR